METNNNSAPVNKKSFFHTGRLISGIILTIINITFDKYPVNIVTWILFILTMALLIAKTGFGIATIVFSVKANNAYQNDNINDAVTLYKKACKVNGTGWTLFGFGAVCSILYQVIMFAYMASAISTMFH